MARKTAIKIPANQGKRRLDIMIPASFPTPNDMRRRKQGVKGKK